MATARVKTAPLEAALALTLVIVCGLTLDLEVGPRRAHAALAVDDDVMDAGALAPGSDRSPFPELELDGVHAPPEYVWLARRAHETPTAFN